MAAHRLSEKDTENRTAVCAVCGPVSMHFHGQYASGAQRWSCDNNYRTGKRKSDAVRALKVRRPWRLVVSERLDLMTCEKCGFVAEDKCQLDVDHVVRRADGGTDDPSNLEVLCANCHRLKSKLEQSI